MPDLTPEEREDLRQTLLTITRPGRFVRQVQRLLDERDRLAAQRYLPLSCPGCGRVRVEYWPSTYRACCEKCGRDSASDHDLKPDRPEWWGLTEAEHAPNLARERDTLRAWAERAAAVLEEMEAANSDCPLPACWRLPHDPDCALAALLREWPATQAEAE